MSNNNKAVMLSLEKHIQGITRSLNAVTYNTMAAIVQRVDEVSPVGDVSLWKRPSSAPKGYRGGQFRGNWQLGVDEKPVGDLPGNIDPEGVDTVGKNIAAIPLQASRHKFYLVNNLPYAMILEEGQHSTQVLPGAMLFRVKREFNGIVRKVIADIKANGGRVR
jgi:hypothetical protein